ncbi:betaine--homocysteine S-methyltransferase 1-like [Acanthaster planci]|uniref:Betaine--homocysteine S-methyltransferase 1-like n=1 Tax=Acanthaster planci TaxID=133434 RepID=A0A8B7Z547_ACAPL|nr:betaine--homocysteine S-methyltransferase 1-like [Acanthaster planci]
MPGKVKGLMDRLRDGETVVIAEGYLFVFERRGYLKAGAFVPEVVVEYPHLVRQQYEEFYRAGSDVVLAFTYYAHREKVSLIERESDIEKMNRTALRMAREVADQTGSLMAGNICNSNIYEPNNPDISAKVKDMFKEQIEWAVEEGADFILAETFSDFGEALLALEAVKEYGKGLPVIVNLAWHKNEVNGRPATIDGVEICETFKRLEAAGADVLGLNCARGPATMLPLMEEIQKCIKTPLAAIPVPYRTTKAEPNFQSLTDPLSGVRLFHNDLDAAMCSRSDIKEFGKRCMELGIQVVGICCGNDSHYTRTLCETLGREVPASRYSTDMSKHYLFGTNDKLSKRFISGEGKQYTT